MLSGQHWYGIALAGNTTLEGIRVTVFMKPIKLGTACQVIDGNSHAIDSKHFKVNLPADSTWSGLLS
jgi:hypothetical protein